MLDPAYAQQERAEFVPLDKVMGGTGITDWTVSNASGRGVPKILELARALVDGSASVAGRFNKPIRVFEIGGEYYLESDGRNRTAALKALGVDEVPMMVTHISEPG